MNKFDKTELKEFRMWKETNEDYLKALQKFLDIAENITDEDLKINVISAMLKCDETLTKIAMQHFLSIKFDK